MVTNTYGNMISHSAVCILTAKSWTWVLAFSAYASLIRGTVRIYDTLRSTIWWRSNQSGMQEHWQRPPTSCGGKLFRPHGLGSQGSSAIIGSIGFGPNRQELKGSPSYPSLHVQVAIWLITLHWALTPHSPGHGSTQCSLWHALLEGQSALIVHSGRHATYGSPK